MLRKAILAMVAVVILIATGIGVFVQVQLSKPIPPLVANSTYPKSTTIEGQPPSLPWPASGAAAVSVPQLGIVGTSGDRGPKPIASIAKVMTAHVILQNHPLGLHEQGPTVAVTQQDVATYLADVRDGQSVLPVILGEQLTEYQMLQALMLPSGNNIADMLARWDSGSRDAFVVKMNAKAAELGMTSSHFADASGYAPQTVSTASDLILLGQLAMRDPVFSEIIAQREATLPVADRVFNVNTSLGLEGNIGIKTGSTPEAGACFLFAARRMVGAEEMIFVGAVLDQNFLSDAFERSAQLAVAASNGMRTGRLLSQTDVIGTYSAPWGALTEVTPTEDVDFWVWPGMAVHTDVQLDQLRAPLPRGARVGSLTIGLGDQSQTVDLVTTQSIPEPTQEWRLMTPFREMGLTK